MFLFWKRALIRIKRFHLHQICLKNRKKTFLQMFDTHFEDFVALWIQKQKYRCRHVKKVESVSKCGRFSGEYHNARDSKQYQSFQRTLFSNIVCMYRRAYLIPLVFQLKLVTGISLMKIWRLVMSLARSRDWCELCKPETKFWWHQRKLRMTSPSTFFCQKTFFRKFQGRRACLQP